MNSSINHPDEPLYIVDGFKLDELELLLGGLLAPARGYSLPEAPPTDGPLTFPLAVPEDIARRAVAFGSLQIADPDGTPLARLAVSGSRPAEAGVAFLAGSLRALRPAEHPPARHLRLTTPLPPPSTAQRSRVVAAFSAPPSAAHIARAVHTAERHGAQLWLVAVAGPQEHGRYTVGALLATVEECASAVPGSRTGLLIVPSSPVDTDESIRRLRTHLLVRLGAETLLDFTAASPTLPSAAAAITATGQSGATGAVVLLTGLSGSGKSTIARALVERLQATGTRPTTLLDGDDVRRLLSAGLGFSREDRELNVRRLGWVASLIAGCGGIAVCAPIAPFEATRQEVREMAERAGSFVLVHVATPLEVCEQRDRKGLYARARAGNLPAFTGIDSPYERPQSADVVVDTATTSVQAAVTSILAALAGVLGGNLADGGGCQETGSEPGRLSGRKVFAPLDA